MSETSLKLGVIIASTRPGRIGGSVGKWIFQQAREHGRFDVDLIDLADINLPFADEPNHPASGKYLHGYTKSWSLRIAACQAFVIVTPEYNHGYPAALKNALDLINKEWWYKPVGFASYGGVSGGLRSVQQLKQVVAFLRMIPMAEAFVAPFVANQVSEGQFAPNDIQTLSTTAMLDELLAVGAPLRHLHVPPPAHG